ncbi:MAG: hypothetical protein GX052_00085 [Syntrophomonadaceae bacterium]|nr:hypothetical protein [Syntrophomonadaceae bacterium]
MAAILDNTIVQLVVVIVGIWAFWKFCTFAKKFSLPGKVKLVTYIITGLGVVFLNWLFSSAKQGMGAQVVLTNPKLMAVTIIASLFMVLLFSFALMAETKA